MVSINNAKIMLTCAIGAVSGPNGGRVLIQDAIKKPPKSQNSPLSS